MSQSSRTRRFFSRSWRAWVLAALALMLAWGAWERQRRMAAERTLVAAGQRDFYQVLGDLDGLGATLGKAEVSGSSRQQIMLLTSAWRRAWNAQENLARLPVSDVDLGRTQQFLSQVGDFCYSLAERMAAGQAASPADRENLAACRRQVAETSARLHEIEPMLVREAFKSFTGGASMWTAVSRRFWWVIPRESPAAVPGSSHGTLAGPASDAQAPQAPGQDQAPGSDGRAVTARQRFRELNEFLDGLPTLVYDGPFSAHLQDRKPEGLSGPSVSEEQAVQACLDFLGKKPGTKAGFRVSGTQLISLPFETYAITLSRTDAAPGAPPAGSSPALRAAAPGPGDVSVAVSKVGGKVLWMMDDAAVSASPATSRDDAVRVAREFLVKLGFGEMEPTSTLLSEGNVLAISFVPVRNGTLLYAEQVKTAVSLGSGEIVAFDASQYYMTPMQKVPKPRLSPEQAKAKLSREVAVKSIRPALIPLPNGRDVLTYEVKASRDSTDYLIYINASNGQEEMILQLVETEKGTLAI